MLRCSEVGGFPRTSKMPKADASHRRHLDESQRAMVAAKIATLPRGTNQHAQICAPTQDNAADLLNVSRSGVQRSRQVLEHGQPGLIAAIERGDIAVSAAAAVATLPPSSRASFRAGRLEPCRQ
jgi:hypothetical protein